MDKRILLPTDFSKNALNAIIYALDFYQNERCIFYILNAFWADKEPTDVAMLVAEPGDKTYELAKKASEDGLATLMQTIARHAPNPKHSFREISSYSSLLFALRDTIAKTQIELIILGTKGISDEDDALFGSNTFNVMEFITECPILAVPGNYKFTGLKKIIFPTAFETAFDKEKLNYLVQIAKSHQSEIHIVHVRKGHKLDQEQEMNRVLLETVFDGIAYNYHILTDISVYKGIHSFIEGKFCDLIVFVTEKSNYFGNELPKPLIKELESHLIIPVLTLHPIA